MSRSPHLARIVTSFAAAAVMLVVGTACTSEAPAPSNPDPNAVASSVANSKPGGAPAPATRCVQSGNTTARKVVLTTSDKVNLSGVGFGAGNRGVLLLPQAGADLCRWWDYASELVAKGYRVLAIDFRGTGYSDNGKGSASGPQTGPPDRTQADGKAMDYTADAEAGIASLKADGAARVVIIGASLGAATALVTAARVPDQVAGVVSLSYPDNALDVTGHTGNGPHTPIEAAPKLTMPVMLCFTATDKQAAAAKPQDLIAKISSTAKQLVGRPGVSHGWDMLKIGDDDVRSDVLTFLQSYA